MSGVHKVAVSLRPGTGIDMSRSRAGNGGFNPPQNKTGSGDTDPLGNRTGSFGLVDSPLGDLCVGSDGQLVDLDGSEVTWRLGRNWRWN